MNKGIIILANIKNGKIQQKLVEFDEETDIWFMLHYAVDNFAFCIPKEKDRILWANIINSNWKYLDDIDYYSYEKPFCYDSGWMCLLNCRFYPLEEVKFLLEEKCNELTKLQKNTN